MRILITIQTYKEMKIQYKMNKNIQQLYIINIVERLGNKYQFNSEDALDFLKIKKGYPLTIDTDKNEKKKVVTEDTGKIFEMAICKLYDIEYDGKYKYSLDDANYVKDKLHKLKELFPYQIKHIAKNGNKYDFKSVDSENVYLSAKTTKKDGKVCPQVIGQPSKKKFCEYFEIDLVYSLDQIKYYIEINITKLLKIYYSHTFDCPVVYYNKNKEMILFIRLKEEIDWSKYDISFSHIIKNKKWNESSTISVNNVAIGEFQIHNHRDCIKFRWYFETLLQLFKDHFEVIDFSS
jgi:hypothetical protein